MPRSTWSHWLAFNIADDQTPWCIPGVATRWLMASLIQSHSEEALICQSKIPIWHSKGFKIPPFSIVRNVRCTVLLISNMGWTTISYPRNWEMAGNVKRAKSIVCFTWKHDMMFSQSKGHTIIILRGGVGLVGQFPKKTCTAKNGWTKIVQPKLWGKHRAKAFCYQGPVFDFKNKL